VTRSDTVDDAALVFAGDSEMRARCRALDWSTTPLGPVSAWPLSLRTAAQIALGAGFPTIVLWGPELVQIYNDGYREFMVEQHPAGLGQPTRDCWPEHWPINEPIYRRVLGGETLTFDDAPYPIYRNGELTEGYFTLSYSPIRDDAGEVAGVFITLFDTTKEVMTRDAQAERERLHRELEVERTRLEYVFRSAPSFLAVLRGPTHVFELVNDAYHQLVGHRDPVGKSFVEAIPEIRGQGFQELLDGVLTTGTPYLGREVPVLLQRSPGGDVEERFIDFSYIPVVEVDGSRSGVIAHGTDVTEQVRARREVERLLRGSELARTALDHANTALRASEARLRDLFEQAPVAVAVLNGPEHIYTIVSPVYAGTPGNGRQLLGRSLVQAFPELVDQEIPKVMDEVYRTGIPYSATERPVLLDRDGDGVPEEYRFNVGYHPLRDADGEVYAVASVAIEVTEQVRARRELEMAREAAEEARREAEQANRAKADFLATMSHELRTPLNAIGGYAELLELGIQGPVTPEQLQSLGRIRTSQRHLLGLINQVLNYTRVEAGAVRYEIEAVEVAQVLATCEALTAPQMHARALSFTTPPQASPLAARADREKLQQIILNLLSNAIKFTEAGGTISISAEARGGEVVISVHDTGMGIPADQLEHIFEPFVQVDAKLTRSSEGVGLGLAISRDLARGMGGDLVAESAERVGSTFTLRLPRA
jgi:PAS domain S-box-containing protein